MTTEQKRTKEKELRKKNYGISLVSELRIKIKILNPMTKIRYISLKKWKKQGLYSLE